MIQADIVVIGGGPAGISAAIEGARRGLKTVLIDESRALGGKVLRQDVPEGSRGHGDRRELKVRRQLFGELERLASRVTVLSGAEVWNVDGKVVSLWDRAGACGSQTVQGKTLIVAVGAKDQLVPFPGWQLPGVFTIGGLNNFTQRGVYPAKRVLVGGAGPLQIALTYNLLCAGVGVSGLVDVNSLAETATSAWRIFQAGGVQKLMLGARYMAKIKARGVPVYYRHVVKEAIGVDKVRAAVVTRVDGSGKLVPGSEREIAADAIAVAYGLVPQTEITQLCGCRHHHDARLGYWIAERNEGMETSVEGVFVAGDGADIKGYEAAIDEGRLAGISACARLGAADPDRDASLAELRLRLRSARAVGAVLSSSSKVRPGLVDLVTDDTIVCRCEETRYGDVRAGMSGGARDIADLKRRTRLGMGHCQGRSCSHVLHELMQKASGTDLTRALLAVKPPLKPVPLEVIADAVTVE